MKRCIFFIFSMFLLFTVSALADQTTLYPIEENGRFGYINHDGEVVIAPQYAEVTAFDDYGIALVKGEDGQYSLIDSTGKIIVTCPEITRNAISYNLYPDPETPGYAGMGLYSPTTGSIIYFDGQILDEPCTDPESTRVLVADWDTYGYADRTTGEIVIPLQYKTVRYDWTQMSDPGYDLFVAYDFAVFHEGYAIVGDENKNFTLIDEMGNTVPLPGEPITNVHEGKLNIWNGEGWQVCTVEGEILSDTYDEIRPYRSGYCCAFRWYVGGDWPENGPELFILDSEGREVYRVRPYIGADGWDFSPQTQNGYFDIGDYASFGEYSEIHHMDKGLLCIVPEVPLAIDYDRELMVVYDGLGQSLCRLDGTELYRLPFNACRIYDTPNFFEDGLWMLCADNEQGRRRFGYLREDGTWQIPPQYVEAEAFCNGLALCTDEEGYLQYIDTDGNVVWKSSTPADVREKLQALDISGIWYQRESPDTQEARWLYIDEHGEARLAFSSECGCTDSGMLREEELSDFFPDGKMTRDALEENWTRYEEGIKPVASLWHRNESQYGREQYIRIFADGTYERLESDTKYSILLLKDVGRIEADRFVSSVFGDVSSSETRYAVQDGRLLFYREGTVTFSRDDTQSENRGLYGLNGWYVPFGSANWDIPPYGLDGEFELLDGGVWEYTNEQTQPACWKLESDTLTLTTLEGESYLLTVDEKNEQLFYFGTKCLIFEPCPIETLDEFESAGPAAVYQQDPSVFPANPLD